MIDSSVAPATTPRTMLPVAPRSAKRDARSKSARENPRTPLTAPNALLVFPKFNPNSFWSLQQVCDMAGARCPAPPLGLITLAALLPPEWNIRLVNRNAEDLTADDLEWADVVMTGGMIPQQDDTLELIDHCRSIGKPVVVGGPDATSSPELYQAADFLVLGEAEGIIDQFIAAWSSGTKSGRFEGPKFQVDVTKSPVPRFDLLNPKHYLYLGVQFSRGCPFNCEFCDIIELYGRVPRAKSNEQMLGELERLYQMGYRGHVDFVDDNLIGNKKRLKQFLPALSKWQRTHSYPFKFSTEASMNLADDSQLLAMLKEANFFAIFMGIESPDPETLISTQKKQNTKRSFAETIHRVYDAGMLVTAGFIVGFDTEKPGVAEAMIEAIDAMSIPVAMVGLLTALPNTQLTRRLEKEGRLLPFEKNKGDQCTGGLNFITLRPRRDVLADFQTVLKGVYDPAAYFDRVRKMAVALNRPNHPSKFSLGETVRDYRVLARLMWCMTVQRRDLRPHFWRTLIYCARNNLSSLEYAITMMVFYLHLGTFANVLIKDLDRMIAELDRDSVQAKEHEQYQQRQKVPERPRVMSA
jgi:radical SAM superfamily enzyme YgiQ (UPF0313 family)